MNVHSVAMRAFMVHDTVDLVLPKAGVIAVTGPNGVGKSSLVEAVSWGLFGKTLRGAAPWREDAKEPCEVTLITDQVGLTRQRRGDKGELRWAQQPYATPVTFPTVTKAQEALERVVGPFELWRRSSAFSSADAAHFSLATDAERKRFIESILGLDKFDGALEHCRSDLRLARDGVVHHESEAALLAERLGAAEQRSVDAHSALEQLGDLPERNLSLETAARLAEVKKWLQDIREEATTIERDLRTARDRVVRSQSNTEEAARRLQVLVEAGVCPTCRRPVDSHSIGELRKLLQRVEEEAKTELGREEAEASVRRPALGELRAEEEALSKRREELCAQQAVEAVTRDEATRYKQQRALQEQIAREAKLAKKQALEEAEAVRQSLEQARTQVALLGAVESVLGLRGVRAHVLGRALSGISAAAAAWAHRLGREFRPVLVDVDGKVDLQVMGLGRGDYRSCSAGERRRVDLALLFALGEVAAAARGRQPGTMFLDECGDHLDRPGTTSLAAALGELATSRAIVVVTHSEALAAELPAVQRVAFGAK